MIRLDFLLIFSFNYDITLLKLPEFRLPTNGLTKTRLLFNYNNCKLYRHSLIIVATHSLPIDDRKYVHSMRHLLIVLVLTTSCTESWMSQVCITDLIHTQTPVQSQFSQ